MRKKVSLPLEISDMSRGTVLGHLIDISMGGLMVLTRNPVPANSVLRLSLAVPEEVGDGAALEFGAESLWTEPSHDPAKYWVGFQIIDIGPENRATLERLIDVL